MSFTERYESVQGRQWICFNEYRMSNLQVQRLYGVAVPEGPERRHWSDCGSDSARACNAYRIGRGTVLEGKIPGVLLTPRAKNTPALDELQVLASVRMPVVHVGIVWMRMDEWRVNVVVRVRLAPIPGEVVSVLVMLVMVMRMRVFLMFVHMQMRVPLRNMQPDARCHRHARDGELPGDRLATQHKRERRTKEWGDREIGAGSRRTEVAQGDHEQRETDSIAGESDDCRRRRNRERRHHCTDE